MKQTKQGKHLLLLFNLMGNRVCHKENQRSNYIRIPEKCNNFSHRDTLDIQQVRPT